HGAQDGRLPAAGEAHERDELPPLDAHAHAAQHLARAAIQAEVLDGQNTHAEGALHRSSSVRAMRESGRERIRYSAAHSAPGMTQLPMFVAKMDVCLVSSTTVMTETSDESLSSATKSLVIGARASRKACGPRTSRNTCTSVSPSV